MPILRIAAAYGTGYRQMHPGSNGSSRKIFGDHDRLGVRGGT